MLGAELLHEIVGVGLVDDGQQVLVLLLLLGEQLGPIAEVLLSPALLEGGFGERGVLLIVAGRAERVVRSVDGVPLLLAVRVDVACHFNIKPQ